MSTIQAVLFESPVVVPAVIAAVGLATAFVVAGRGKSKHALVAAIVFLAAAGGVGVASRVVETDREEVSRRSVELIEHIEVGDGEAAHDYLSDRLVLAASGQQVLGDGLPTTLRRIDWVAGYVQGLTPSVQDVVAQPTGDLLLTISVRAELSLGTVPTSAELTWRDEGDAWRVVRINLLRLGTRDASPEAVRQAV